MRRHFAEFIIVAVALASLLARLSWWLRRSCHKTSDNSGEHDIAAGRSEPGVRERRHSLASNAPTAPSLERHVGSSSVRTDINVEASTLPVDATEGAASPVHVTKAAVPRQRFSWQRRSGIGFKGAKPIQPRPARKQRALSHTPRVVYRGLKGNARLEADKATLEHALGKTITWAHFGNAVVEKLRIESTIGRTVFWEEYAQATSAAQSGNTWDWIHRKAVPVENT